VNKHQTREEEMLNIIIIIGFAVHLSKVLNLSNVTIKFIYALVSDEKPDNEWIQN
jgi:hypothetical protein